MKILKRNAAVFRDKGDGTAVYYYLFPEYEIHYNEIQPGTTQQWHHHEMIEEALYVLDGELMALWREGGKECSTTVSEGDVVRVEDSPHTFRNASNQTARFIVFKLVLDGADKRELLKNDKVVDGPAG